MAPDKWTPLSFVVSAVAAAAFDLTAIHIFAQLICQSVKCTAQCTHTIC